MEGIGGERIVVVGPGGINQRDRAMLPGTKRRVEFLSRHFVYFRHFVCITFFVLLTAFLSVFALFILAILFREVVIR